MFDEEFQYFGEDEENFDDDDRETPEEPWIKNGKIWGSPHLTFQDELALKNVPKKCE